MSSYILHIKKLVFYVQHIQLNFNHVLCKKKELKEIVKSKVEIIEIMFLR